MNNDILVIYKNVGAGTGDLLGTGPCHWALKIELNGTSDDGL